MAAAYDAALCALPYLERDLQWGHSASSADRFVCAVFSPLSLRLSKRQHVGQFACCCCHTSTLYCFDSEFLWSSSEIILRSLLPVCQSVCHLVVTLLIVHISITPSMSTLFHQSQSKKKKKRSFNECGLLQVNIVSLVWTSSAYFQGEKYKQINVFSWIPEISQEPEILALEKVGFKPLTSLCCNRVIIMPHLIWQHATWHDKQTVEVVSSSCIRLFYFWQLAILI